MPNTPEFLEGVFPLRGEVIPIIDLRKRFQLNIVQNKNQKIIITSVDGLKTGFMIDDILQVRKYVPSDIQKPPASLSKVHDKYIQGVIRQNDELIIMLNLDVILSFEMNIDKISDSKPA